MGEEEADEKVGTEKVDTIQMKRMLSPISSTIDKMDAKLKRMGTMDYIRNVVFQSSKSIEDWQLEQTAKRVHQNYEDLMSCISEDEYECMFGTVKYTQPRNKKVQFTEESTEIIDE